MTSTQLTTENRTGDTHEMFNEIARHLPSMPEETGYQCTTVDESKLEDRVMGGSGWHLDINAPGAAYDLTVVAPFDSSDDLWVVVWDGSSVSHQLGCRWNELAQVVKHEMEI